MNIEITFALLICFLIGAFTAYKDLASFFIERRIGVARMRSQTPALAFIAINGFIAMGMLGWAITDSGAAINSVLSDNTIANGFIVGLSVPMLIRSKWFSLKEDGSSPAGLEAIYLKFRTDVLYQVHKSTVTMKEQLAESIANKLEGNEPVLEKVIQHVISVVKPFRSKDEIEELKAEFEAMKPVETAESASKKHLCEVFVWAMDNCGIDHSMEFLDGMAEGA